MFAYLYFVLCPNREQRRRSCRQKHFHARKVYFLFGVFFAFQLTIDFQRIHYNYINHVQKFS